jgi:hypothetical protein
MATDLPEPANFLDDLLPFKQSECLEIGECCWLRIEVVGLLRDVDQSDAHGRHSEKRPDRVDDGIVLVHDPHQLPFVEGGAGVPDAKPHHVADLQGAFTGRSQIGMLIVQRTDRVAARHHTIHRACPW